MKSSLMIVLAVAMLTACGGEQDEVSAEFEIRGQVEGLGTGASLSLRLNDGLPQEIQGSGPFSLSPRLPDRTPYRVDVIQTPPSLACATLYGHGVVDSRDVSDVLVFCGASTPSTGRALPDMGAQRMWHTALRLGDGRVLVAGGMSSGGTLSSAELFDPLTEQWRPAGVMSERRSIHQALVLKDGRTVVFGGHDGQQSLRGVEAFDPAAMGWVTRSPMPEARAAHVALQLKDGRVLVAGGFNETGRLASASLYDVTTDSWLATGSTTVPRSGAVAVMLEDGRVLLAGGFPGSGGVNLGPTASVELYDPDTGKWTMASSMSRARYGHVMVMLPDGRVLAAGGSDGLGAVADVEVFDPADGLWRRMPISWSATDGAGILLASGKVLLLGVADAPALLIDPVAATAAPLGPALPERRAAMATRLADGRVLVTGGSGPTGVQASAWAY